MDVIQRNELFEGIARLTDANDIASCKQLIAKSHQWIDQQFETVEIAELILGRAEFVDTLLQHLWTLKGLGQCKHLALVAVGGYGRGHLQPYSDIDLLFVYKRRLSQQQQSDISQFITLLWDLGLDVGQAVRSIDDNIAAAKQDITIATNLLEARHLAGNQKVFERLRAKIQGRKFCSRQHFYQAKLLEQQQRHAKYHGTAYNLEPNIKENPGGLRDIQTIGWVARREYFNLAGRDLVLQGYLSAAEHQELIACRYHLWKIRCALHLTAGRSENRLLFDYQSAVAVKLGYGDDGKKSVETMMKSFFRTVRQVRELNEMLLQRLGQQIIKKKVKRISRLSAELEIHDGLLVVTNPVFFETPLRVLQFFQLIAEQPTVTGLHSDTIQLLRNARRTFTEEPWQQYPECRRVFIALMADTKFFGVAWDLMHKYGILQSYLAPWANIVGMMQFDLFHAYTVDEHTNRLIKNIYHYSSADGKEQFPRCHRIMNNLDKPELLYLAAIFHDIAKGRNGDHSILGAQDVRQFCQLHQLDESDGKLIEWLVEQHLLMSTIAQRRDIYDPDVIHEFANKVRNKNQLNHLYALTLADIRATNDNLWNDWKASLLRELYTLTRQAFKDGLESTIDLESRIVNHKTEAMALLCQDGYSDEIVTHLWKQIGDKYFIRYNARQIAWHTASILSRDNDSELLVSLNDNTHKAGTELLVYGKDKPSLFAQVASVLDSRNCSIHDAQILTNRDGSIFDVFTILNHDTSRISTTEQQSSLRNAIIKQLDKQGTEHSNSRQLPRRMKHLTSPTKIRFFNPRERTLLELEALDIPGLLATISHAFVVAKVNLHMAKITTIGERAEDTFIITNPEQKALTIEQEVELKRIILENLAEQTDE